MRAHSVVAKTKASQNPATLNPPTMLAHKSTMSALITSEKRPSVKIVTGNERKLITGLMKALMRPSTTATTIDTHHGLHDTPGSNQAVTSIDIAEIRSLVNIVVLVLNHHFGIQRYL